MLKGVWDLKVSEGNNFKEMMDCKKTKKSSRRKKSKGQTKEDLIKWMTLGKVKRDETARTVSYLRESPKNTNLKMLAYQRNSESK